MKKKGFTLIELIIVIAIIGVLMGVLIPSWGNYMSRSRTRAQNLKAKTIFNAAQTFATDLKFAERRYVNILTDASASTAKKIEADVNLMGVWDGTTTEWCIYFNGEDVGFCNMTDFKAGGYVPKATVPGTTEEQDVKKMTLCQESANRLRDSIKNIINEKETIYKVYVKDYKVVSVVSSRFRNDRYLGSYPTTLDELEDKGVDVSEIRANMVRNANMSQFGL